MGAYCIAGSSHHCGQLLAHPCLAHPCLPPPLPLSRTSLQTLADKGLAELVHPPKITFRDFEKVLLRARPTVSTDDLQVFTKYTAEFGEEGS
jgi:vacuolar protein-sorting-associated protein 4